MHAVTKWDNVIFSSSEKQDQNCSDVYQLLFGPNLIRKILVVEGMNSASAVQIQNSQSC